MRPNLRPSSPCSLLALSFAAALTLAGTAGAQDIVTAEALFNRGLADMQRGAYDKGCPAIAEAHRLDPRPGTLFTLATCEEKWGHVASAVSRYGDYLALYDRLPPDRKAAPREKERQSTARERRSLLSPDVPELTLVLAPDAPAGTVVKRDGQPMAAAALGVALPVDPGEHTISSQAPGGSEWETKLTVAKGEKKTLAVEVKPAPGDGAPAPRPGERGSGPSGQRVAAYVLGGVGVAGLVVGAVTGGLTLAKKSTIDQHCGAGVMSADPTACDPTGLAAVSSGRTLGWVSTAALIAGGAATGTAIVLFATEPSPAKTGARGRGLPVGVLSIGPTGVLAGARAEF